jgi:isopentenyl diphosphate isomerase/L-lactate dehydrogenase-like FMN-dependent dehydrogenase
VLKSLCAGASAASGGRLYLYALAAAGQAGVERAVGKQDIAVGEGAVHVGGAPSIMSLARRDLQQDRQAIGIDQRMDLGRQPAL